MKQFLSAIITFLLFIASSQAQNSFTCPGLKNPAAFTSGSQVGLLRGFYSGQTGYKSNSPAIAPDALSATTGINLSPNVIPAGQLSNVISTVGTSYCGSSLDPTKRFRIMSDTEGPGTDSLSGYDPLTGYSLPYCPTAFDTSIHKSIRLGNCGTNAEAEALYYTLDVRTTNCLLTFYYAIVVQTPGHSLAVDPSFIIRVAGDTIYHSNNWQQISDTFCYSVSSFEAQNGVDGWHSYGDSINGGVYRDWHKVTINLSKYLYETVRIEIYMSDCAYGGHYGYCYVTGDCQSPAFRITGCNAGTSQEVSTITAPADMINYVWYKSDVAGYEKPSLIVVPDTVGFTQLTPDSSTNNSYTCTLNDFMVTQGDNAGQYTNLMVFRCDMTSAMDPAKPFVTKYYASILNTKPVMAIDTSKSCHNSITLTNQSYLLNNSDGCDIDSTQWWFYNNSQVDSAIGSQVSYQFDSTGIYNIKVRSFYRDDHSCYSDSTYTVSIDNIGSGPFNCDSVFSLSPYTWHNTTYSSSGVYTYTYLDSSGCYIIDTLRLFLSSDTATVAAIANPANAGTVTGAGIFAPGGTCTLTAIPDTAYVFSNWTNGATILSTDPTYSFTVTSDIVLTANFTLAQPGNPACRVFNNPTSFNTPQYSKGTWSARVGDRVQNAGGGSTGNNILSTCSRNSKPFIRGNSNITSSAYYSGFCVFTNSSCNHSFYDAHDHRFQINSADTPPDSGLDIFTINASGQGLPRIPNGHTSSIRLGDMRSTGQSVYNINQDGNNKGSEALYYTMQVTPQNAIILINYAIVTRKYPHPTNEAGEFNIRICGKNSSTGQWNNYPLNDSLWINIPAPNFNTTLPAPWVDGRQGYLSSGISCSYCYIPWSRIAVNLTDYLYDSVRIEFYTSDCIYSVDPLYAYIAGDCQSILTTYSGCNTGDSIEVATLHAPESLDNYVWYRCNMDGQYLNNMTNIPDTIGFTQLTPDSSTQNTYSCTINDFLVTQGENAGQLTNNMVFRCDITSAMNPSRPYTTKLYFRVINNKPVLSIDTLKTCEGGLTLSNHSYIPNNTEGIDTSATQWWFFNNGRVDSTTGATTSYQFDTTGIYNIKVRSFYRDDHSCYSDSTYTVNIHYDTGTFASLTVNSPTPFTWHDQTYTASGIYTYEYIDSNDCLSTDTLHLRIIEDCIINTDDLPYFDNFDGYTFSTSENSGTELPCWHLVPQDDTKTDESNPMVHYNPETSHSGNYSLFLNKRGIIAMPYIDSSINSLHLSFYLMQPQDRFQLQVGVLDNLEDTNTFSPVATINNSSTRFEYIEVDLSSYSGEGHYIAFRNTLAHGQTDDFSHNYIDDLTIEKHASPNGITTDNPDGSHHLKLQPNPTKGMLTVEADDEVVRIDVFDHNGRCVTTCQKQTSVDLSRLASGHYTLRITLSGRIEVRHVVKQ